jgi:hypothetical protein
MDVGNGPRQFFAVIRDHGATHPTLSISHSTRRKTRALDYLANDLAILLVGTAPSDV